jgi:hypothetical protein
VEAVDAAVVLADVGVALAAVVAVGPELTLELLVAGVDAAAAGAVAGGPA